VAHYSFDSDLKRCLIPHVMELVRSPDNVWINLGNWSSTQLELVSTTLLFSTDSALPCSFQHKFKPYHPWPVNGLLRLGNVLEGANTSWKEVQTQTTLGPQRCQSQESISSRRLFPWVNHLSLRPPSLLMAQCLTSRALRLTNLQHCLLVCKMVLW